MLEDHGNYVCDQGCSGDFLFVWFPSVMGLEIHSVYSDRSREASFKNTSSVPKSDVNM